MIVKLQNIKYHPDMSEETPCFSAVLVISGKEVATVKNRGHGGGNDIYALNSDPINRQLIKAAELWATSLPDEKISTKGLEDIFYKRDLESVIFELLENHLTPIKT